MPDLPRLSNDLIQQLRGIFFAKDRSPILSQSNWLGLPLLESTPSVLPSVSNYYFYFKTNGGLYRLDWDGNEIQVNGLDSLPVHTHANNNQGGQLDWDNVWSDAVHDHSSNAEGGVIPLDNTTVSKLRESDDGADALTADSNGYLSSVSQPLFSAYNSVTDTNVTGDGTNYTVICDIEIFDVDGNYNNSTGIFTAPLTGKYLFCAGVFNRNINSAHIGMDTSIVTSNRLYRLYRVHSFNCSAFGDKDLLLGGSIIADMDASDTAYVTNLIAGGTKTVSVFGGTATTYFQGYLLI